MFYKVELRLDEPRQSGPIELLFGLGNPDAVGGAPRRLPPGGQTCGGAGKLPDEMGTRIA
jgi:hypothetical protein